MIDFEEEVPSMTADEIKQWRLDARKRGLLGPERIRWDAPEPTPPALLQEMRFVPQPTPPGQNATADALFAWHYNLDLWNERDKQRRTRLAELGNQKRTQLEADRLCADPKEPYWLCKVEAQGRMPDSGVPPALVRAASSHLAGERFLALVGVTRLDIDLNGDGQKLVVEKWEQTAVI
jgi:hypothetical protein